MKILVINCSGRAENDTKFIYYNILKKLEISEKLEFDIISLYDIYEKLPDYLTIFGRYKCILWLTPEYNRSYSSNVKYFIENLGVENFYGKINGIISTSIGPSSRCGLNEFANLLFSMDTLVIPPGIEYNYLLEIDENTINRIKVLLKNLKFFYLKLL